MISVFHRQWKALAHSPYFYAFLTLFFVGLGGLVAMFHGSYQYANFEYVLWYLSVLLAFILPLLTVRTFFEERKKGMDRFLKALPISARELVLGKFLAHLGLLLLLSVSLLLIPLFLGIWGKVYYPSAYMGIFAFFLFGVAMLAIDTFLALCFRNIWITVGVSYALVGILLALYYLSRVVSEPWGNLFSQLSMFGGFSSFIFGIVDLAAIGCYLSVGALFAFLMLLFANKVWKE